MSRTKLLRRLPLSSVHRANISRPVCKAFIFFSAFQGYQSQNTNSSSWCILPNHISLHLVFLPSWTLPIFCLLRALWRYGPSKRLLSLTGLHGVTFRRIEHFMYTYTLSSGVVYIISNSSGQSSVCASCFYGPSRVGTPLLKMEANSAPKKLCSGFLYNIRR
jgi:hypothetical protein